MADTIVTALISAVAALGAAAIPVVYKARQARRKTDQLVSDAANQAAAQLPYVVESELLSLRFGDDGSGEYRRELRGISVRQEIQNLRIPFKWDVACPGAKLLQPFGGPASASDPPVDLEIRESTDKGSKGDVVINAFLSPRGDPVSVVFGQPFAKAVCMTRSEAEAAYRNDAWRTEYIVGSPGTRAKTLRVQVDFPPGQRQLTQRPRPVVFQAKAEEVHGSELGRVQDRLSYIDGRAILTVDDPVVGLRYGISWMPPG